MAIGPRCAPVLLRAQGGMLCPPWVETGPFESCGLYQFIVQLWLCLSPLMSQHTRERINELVLGQMSSIVNAGNSGSKGTKYSSANLLFMPPLFYTPSLSLLLFCFLSFFWIISAYTLISGKSYVLQCQDYSIGLLGLCVSRQQQVLIG